VFFMGSATKKAHEPITIGLTIIIFLGRFVSEKLMKQQLRIIIPFVLLMAAFAAFLVTPWPKLLPVESGRDFAMFVDLAKNGTIDSPAWDCNIERPCYIVAQPIAAGWFVHFYRYPDGVPMSSPELREGLVYNMASNGAGGWLVKTSEDSPSRAHAGPFHRIDPVLLAIRDEAVAFNCTLSDIMGMNRSIENGTNECQFTLNPTGSFEILPVPLQASFN
jgi:hypothetical protein